MQDAIDHYRRAAAELLDAHDALARAVEAVNAARSRQENARFAKEKAARALDEALLGRPLKQAASSFGH